MDDKSWSEEAFLVAILVLILSTVFSLAQRWKESRIVLFTTTMGSQQQPPEAQLFTRHDTLQFPYFAQLNPEICLHILSFVAAAPFEQEYDNNNHAHHHVSCLTHVLPLVSKQFYQWTFQDDTFLWKDALIRQAARQPKVWKRAIVRLLRKEEQQPEDESVLMSSWSPDALVDRLLVLQQETRTTTTEHSCPGLELYKRVLNTQVRYTGPIFAMPHTLELNRTYGLHFFEPRYRRLIAQVMEPFPASAREGGAIVCNDGSHNNRTLPDPPVFLHANSPPTAQGRWAWLVQVQFCRIYEDGRADVLLRPVQYVKMELFWEVPNSGDLYMGQAMRVVAEEGTTTAATTRE